MNMSESLNDQERDALTALSRAIQPFRDIHKTPMPASALTAFCLIAMREGRTMIEYARASNVSPMAMSRTVQDMGTVNRYGGTGLGIVEQRTGHGRSVTVHLTVKGRAFARKVAGALLPKVAA